MLAFFAALRSTKARESSFSARAQPPLEALKRQGTTRLRKRGDEYLQRSAHAERECLRQPAVRQQCD
jgi:hypothetical protein